MDEMTIRAAEIELYSDLVKIGIPSLAAFATALIGIFSPIWLEKSKARILREQEARDYHRRQVSELVDCLSRSSANIFKYSYYFYSPDIDTNEILQNKAMDAGFAMLDHEYDINKARFIAAVLGEGTIVDLIDAFDRQATITLRDHVGPDLSKARRSLKLLRKREREMLDALNSLYRIPTR